MNSKDNIRLFNAVATALKVSPEIINLDTSTDDLESWDSFGHLIVIMEVEKNFNVKFSSEDIPTLSSIKKLQDALGNKIDI